MGYRQAEGSPPAEEHRVTSTNDLPWDIYLRLSTKDRAGSEGVGLTLDRQEAECRALLATLGGEVGTVLRDDDRTAMRTARSRRKPREGYAALLGHIRDGSRAGVVCWHTDRLHREPLELEDYIKAVEAGGAVFRTETVRSGRVDLNTPTGRYIARNMAGIAKLEVEHMLERQKGTKDGNRAAGAWSGGPRPFGYERDGASIKQGGRGALRQVPAEAEAVREGYRLFNSGVSLAAIAREWNARGLLTPAQASRGGGNRWQAITVRNVLYAARNAGLVEYRPRTAGRQIVAKGNWEPIVSEDTWRAARAVLSDPARRTTPGPKPRWLLTGILICGKCGSRHFRLLKRPNGRYNYVCNGVRWNEPGARFHISRVARYVDAYVEQVIIERLSQPDTIPALVKPSPDLAALEARATVLRGRKADASAAYDAGEITLQDWTDGTRETRAELEKIEKKIEAAIEGSPLEEFRAGEDPAKIWAGLSLERKRAVAALLLRVKLLPASPRNTFDPGSVEILWERVR
jgi:site-specific DNA recombinase